MALTRRQDPGGEVELDTGFGHIVKLEAPKSGGRNAVMEIKAEHLDRFPLGGKVDTKNVTLWEAVQALAASGARVAYVLRIERKHGIDPTIPFDQLRSSEKRGDPSDKQREWEFVGPAGVGTTVAPAAALPTQAAVPAPAPVTVPASAPPPAPAPIARAEAPAQGSPRIFPQADDGPPVCPLCGKALAGGGPIRKHQATGRFAHLEPCLKDTQPAAAGQAAPEAGPVPTSPNRSGPRLAEARPWERTLPNTDTLNLGSYAIKASADMVFLAKRLLREYMVARGMPLPPSPDSIKRLAARLLMAADRCQELFRPDGHFDRNDNSHNRARDAVKEALIDFPVPFEGPPEALQAERDQWVCQLAQYAAELVRAAIALDR